jgi:3-methyladenine DNA glycosylase Tag
VRHRPKLDAIVHNARRLVALADEHGSFAAWLAGLGDADAACAAVRSEFRWLGAHGAAWVLRVLGGPAPA